MKGFIICALVTVLTASPDHRPRPRPRDPRIFVRPVQRADSGEDLEFKFGIVSRNVDLNVENVKFIRVDKRASNATFDVKVKAMSDNEIKEWMDQYDKDFPLPKSAIIGRVSAKTVTCDHRGLYAVVYGKKGEKGFSGRRVFVSVGGCKDDDKDKRNLLIEGSEEKGKVVIFSRRFKPVKKGSAIKYRFVILKFGGEIKAEEASFGRLDKKFVENDLEVSYEVYSKEEIKAFFEKKGFEPTRMPDSALVGIAEAEQATCYQNTKYNIGYGDVNRVVRVKVLGCGHRNKRDAIIFPEAKERVSIHVRPHIPFRQGVATNIRFAVHSYNTDLDVSKVAFGRMDRKLVKDDLKASYKHYSAEDIKKIAEEKGWEGKRLPQNVIVGEAVNEKATCDQNTRYSVSYGESHRDVNVRVLGCR